MNIEIITGDCREELKTLPDASVQCCVSSPPYWGLRDYGHGDQIGLEPTPEAYVKTMVEVFREVKRVLRDDGTLWLNLGDSYAGGGNYRGINSESTLSEKQRSNGGARGVSQLLGSVGKEYGLAPKNLVGIPWRVAFALQADGWYLRSDIIWHKPNPMPESVTDRPTKSHEYIFLLTKRERYFYDAEAIKEQASESYRNDGRWESGPTDENEKEGYALAGARNPKRVHSVFNGERKQTVNKRDVWTIPTASFSEAHFATFPPDLIKPCILAGTKPGDVVLDPFGGSGCTGMVALELGRKAILIELNPDYVELSKQRCNVTPGFQLA
jgi:DNA modification methylase